MMSPGAPASILVVDAHQGIRDPLSTHLRRFNFEIEAVADAGTALQLTGLHQDLLRQWAGVWTTTPGQQSRTTHACLGPGP